MSSGPHRKPFCVMILAGEASGDLHGGALSSSLFKKDPTLRLIGIGGPAMKKAGVDIRYDIAHLGIVGLWEIFPKALSLWRGYHIAKAMLQEAHLLVLIDFPDFNLRIAKIAKQLGIPVVYYIAPQVWAWRKGRIKTIAERVDKVLVIFPFEEEIYRQAEISCEFVGHPLLDHARPLLEKPFSRADYLREKGVDPSALTIGLLPGSRESEIKRHLPIMLQGIEQLVATATSDKPRPLDTIPTAIPLELPNTTVCSISPIKNIRVFIPVAPTISIDLVRNLTRSSSVPIVLVPGEGEIYSLLRAVDAAVVASGTATLEAALTNTPMVVLYITSRMTYLLVRLWLYIKWISLVNIVAQTDLVPELIQDQANPRRMGHEVKRILENKTVSDQIKEGLGRVAASLGTKGASQRAAEAIYEILLKKVAVP